MTSGIGLCWACKHNDPEGTSSAPVETGVCKAFPRGIPVEIFAGGFDHREPFPGDNGIRFVPTSAKIGEMALANLDLLSTPDA